MKLLVADDEKTTLLFLRKIATNWGYEVVEAADGTTAMEILSGPDAPRIAVIDWLMPGIDGVDICRRLQNSGDDLNTYRILLTQRTEKADIVHALDHGAHDYLTKPVYVEELRSRVNVGRRLIEAMDRAKALAHDKNRFLGIAAHDLRNPLGSIINIVELMRSGLLNDFPDKRAALLGKIGKTTDHMLDLVNDLLSVSVIESGLLELNKKPASMAEVIDKCIQMAEHLARKKEMRIQTDFQDVPPFPFDAHRISQVVDNLFSNAIKFSPPGATITIALRRYGDGVRVCVADEGPGFGEAEQARLFGPFQRLKIKPTGGEESTGLGLAIVKKIIDMHGGRMEVDSTAGEGATFCFVLPVQ